MPEVCVTGRNGETTRVEVPTGMSLMQVLCEAGFDEILALCGGVCSCGTCHVYIDGGAGAGLAAMSADEEVLLDGSLHRRENSRLSCQLLVSDAFEGMQLTIAPED